MDLGIRKGLLFSLLFSVTITGFSQNIQNFRYRVQGSRVIVNYDLAGPSENRYLIELFSSADDFDSPLKSVSGDVGPDQVPGEGKEITWNARNDLGSYRGTIQLRIKAIFVPFVDFEGLGEKKFRRGKTLDFSWTGGFGGAIQFELLSNGEKIADLGDADNAGPMSWEMPMDLKPGKLYAIKASGGERSSVSQNFRIYRKVPLALKVVPLIAVGGIVVVIATMEKGGTPTNNNIPDPFEPN